MYSIIIRFFALLGLFFPVLASAAYTDNGDGTVTDYRTGLTWMRCSMGQTWDGSTCTGTASTYAWAAATALTSTFAGKSDWRLPNVRELQTIVDRSHVFPAIDTAAFPNTTASDFWSASPDASNSNGAWGVNFDGGFTSHLLKSYSFSVRLVRGGQSLALLSDARPDTDYTDNGDGTVTHKPTGLMWKKCSEGQTLTGSTCTGTAAQYTLNRAPFTDSFAGKSDWRLPTEDELLSLADYTKYNPAINAALFPGTPSSVFWSGSTFAALSCYCGWIVDFYDGYANGGYDKYFAYSVRLVRGGYSAQIIGPISFGSATLAVGGTAAVGAYATSGLAVSFSSTTPSVCTVTGSISSYDFVTGIAAGTCTIAADQAGNASYSAATQATQNITVTTTSQTGTTLGFVSGWNLLGNSVNVPLDVAATLGDATKVTTVWKWVPATSKWAFYAPSMTAPNLAAYAAGKGYDVLATINGGEGFWVNAKAGFTEQLPAGAAIGSSAFADKAVPPNNLPAGWSLIAVGDSPSPRNFANTIAISQPVSPAVAAASLTTLWAWDSGMSSWYFYAPSLDNSNGLMNYIITKGYLDFTGNGKTLDPTTGFWVNHP